MAASESHWGTMYFPTHAYNNWQIWRDYDHGEVTRDLDRAQAIGVDSIRVLLSYEFWADEAINFRETGTGGNAAVSRLNRFMDAAGSRNMTVIPVLFEPIGGDPLTGPPQFTSDGGVEIAPVLRYDKLNDPDIETSFAMHSPSQSQIIQRDMWGMERQSPVFPNASDGRWFASPVHFTRRVANAVGNHPALLALEIMNEPGVDIPREQFVIDMGNTVRSVDPSIPVTVGAKDFGFQDFLGNINYNQAYEDGINGGLDYHQFHANLTADGPTTSDYLSAAADYRSDVGKPLLCTEWQRTQQEPPNRHLPNYAQVADIFRDHVGSSIDGAYFWGLNLKPAYIETPRRNGRVNGVYRPDGTVLNKEDADAIAGTSTNLQQRAEYPGWIKAGLDSFPFPDPSVFAGGSDDPVDGQGIPLWLAAGVAGAGAAAYYISRQSGDG